MFILPIDQALIVSPPTAQTLKTLHPTSPIATSFLSTHLYLGL